MEEQSQPEVSKYHLLHERGVLLSDHEIDFIISQLEQGSQDALTFLGRELQDWPHLISSNSPDTIGYVVEQQVVNIPIPYLNKLATGRLPLAQRIQDVYSVGLWGPRLSVPYPYWLRLVGREETVHHYQNIGHPLLKASMVEKETGWGSKLEKLDRFLCNVEVEARSIVDQICIANGEVAAWQQLDVYLQRRWPKEYNQPTIYFLENKPRYRK